MRKYEFTGEFKIVNGIKLNRIRRISDDLIGGWIEKETNLSHNGDAWVYDDAKVYGNAWVYGDAKVFDNAWVYGDASVCDDAKVYDDAVVRGDAIVCGNAKVYDDAMVCGDATVYGNARVYGDAKVYDDAVVRGDAMVYGDARVYDDAVVRGDAMVYGDATIYGDAMVYGEINKKCSDFEFYQSRNSRLISALLVDGEWLFNVGCQKLITKEKFIERINGEGGGIENNPHREFYLKILKLF